MLTADVKNKINTARNILVGKIPDPKGQIDQITNALIYKFMDDQDRLSQSVGGNASFFINDLEDFAWHTLFDAKLSNQDRANLYIEGIEKLSKAIHLPKLFQDIFKDAFLPFRASDTIAMFLDCLNGFDYAHSEELGNAFEYLLSIMGSQGNAGQFRTPRHIIEFLVDAVDPQKTETILDPACGTAGFLVESYTHIVQNNQLSAQDKQTLSTNIFGVDIDPGMAKIARVNLYLHGFKTPNITEDDTLTNEKLWEKKYDVILANPPFMTPKGGIVPHDKFEISANRSEVLFVDYIAEHLKLNGRAGIIVPEGIIFQSANAYKALRKKLVEDWGLCAVISLPSGVFQPYSGVKTSILILDRKKASEMDTVLFVKIENDGFDLGAQRREIAKNDLPKALEILKEWQNVGAKNLLPNEHSKIAFAVKKEKIAENGDYNLTGDRYRETVDYSNAKWPMVELGEVCDLESGSRDKGGALKKGIPSIGGEQINSDGSLRLEKMKYVSEEYFETMKKGILRNGDVLVVKDGATTGKVAFFNNQFLKGAVNEHVFIFRAKEQVLPYFLFKAVQSQKFQNDLQKYIKGIIGGISLEIKQIQIPLPPLSVQEQIVAEIEQYQKVIDGAKQVVQNWKPSFRINPSWEMVELGEVCEINPKKVEINNIDKNILVSFVPMAVLNQNQITFESKEIKTLNEVYSGYTYFKENDVLLAKVTPCFENGKSGVAKNLENGIGFGSSEYFIYRADQEKILPEWIYYFISSNKFIEEGKNNMSGTGGLQRLTKEYATSFKIPLPPLSVLDQIVAEIEAEQNAVEECKKLIAVYEKKIEAKIGEVWGE